MTTTSTTIDQRRPMWVGLILPMWDEDGRLVWRLPPPRLRRDGLYRFLVCGVSDPALRWRITSSWIDVTN